MKNHESQVPAAVREFFARIGSKGGKAGSRESKVKAARARWAKRISGNPAGKTPGTKQGAD